eukprot:scaffold240200_cov80-Cyclotella_meneghiniana.AAC.5
MKISQGILLTVLSMHSSLIDAGHHRIQHEHEMMAAASKTGKSEHSSSTSYESKSGKSVYVEHSMHMTDDDMSMMVVVHGKSGKSEDGTESKSYKQEPEMMAKSSKDNMESKT